MMVAYGDRKRRCAQVVTLFNEINPNREPISRATLSKTLQRFKKLIALKTRPTKNFFKCNVGCGRKSKKFSTTVGLEPQHEIHTKKNTKTRKLDELVNFQLGLLINQT